MIDPRTDTKKRRTVDHIRQDLSNAVNAMKRASIEAGAITLGQQQKVLGFDDPAITKRLTDATAYADESAALIMRLFNAAVRKARKVNP